MPNELRPYIPRPSDDLRLPTEPIGGDYKAATWVGILLLVLLVVAAALAVYGRNSGGAGVPRGESGGLVSSCETGEPKPTPYPYPGKPVIG